MKIPKKVIESKEASEYVYYRGYGRTAVIVVRTKVEKKAETSEDLERKERNKRLKIMQEMKNNLNKRRDEFVKFILSGELKKTKDDIDICNALFNILQGLGGWIDYTSVRNDIMGKNYWDLSDEEKKEFRSEYAEKSLTVKLLAVINGNIDRCNYINSDLSYDTDNGRVNYDLFGILSIWGWSFKDDSEESVVSGTHEFYTRGR